MAFSEAGSFGMSETIKQYLREWKRKALFHWKIRAILVFPFFTLSESFYFVQYYSDQQHLQFIVGTGAGKERSAQLVRAPH